jgi:hypothetical protein
VPSNAKVSYNLGVFEHPKRNFGLDMTIKMLLNFT